MPIFYMAVPGFNSQLGVLTQAPCYCTLWEAVIMALKVLGLRASVEMQLVKLLPVMSASHMNANLSPSCSIYNPVPYYVQESNKR